MAQEVIGPRFPGSANSLHLQSVKLDVDLAPGTGNITTNPLRELMNAAFPVSNLGIGNPSEDTFNPAKNSEYDAEAERRYGKAMGQYGPTQGDPGLKEAIAQYYAELHGINVNPSHLVIVNGIQEGIQLFNDLLVHPRRSGIATTNPTYVGFLQANKQLEPTYVPVDYKDSQGLRDAFEKNGDIITYYYTQPTLHNPLSVTQTQEHRDNDLAALREHKKPAFEDSPYLDLYEGPHRRTLHEDEPELSVLAGSMSKIWEPSLRTAWLVVVNDSLRDLIIQKKQGYNIVTGRRDQVKAEFALKDPYLKEHLKNANALYRSRRIAALEMARELLPHDWTTETQDPQGGMYLTFTNSRRPDISTNEVAAKAKKEGVAIVPFEMFALDGNTRGLRANVIYNSGEVTKKGLQIIGQILNEY